MTRTMRILWGLPIAVIAASVAGIGLLAAREALVPPPPGGMFGCIHRWDSTWDCPDFNPQEGVNWVPIDSVAGVVITFELIDGTSRGWRHEVSTGDDRMRNVDAVFFTDAAVWDIWFSYLRARAIPEDSIREVYRTLPRRVPLR